MAENVEGQEEVQEQDLSFWDHIEVLRWALFRIAVFLFVAAIGSFIVMPKIFDTVVLGPANSDFFVYGFITRASHGLMTFDPNFHVEIQNLETTGQFMTHFKVAFELAFIITFPYIIYEIWKFIRPALYDDEIKHLRPAFLAGTLMFYLGCALGYFLIFPFTFRFLTEYELSSLIVNQISLSSYLGNFTMLILIMGIVFEMPLLAWLLSALGIIRKHMLRNYRRHAIAGLMILAAFITPSGDPFTLMLVFMPLYMLYEMSIFVVKEKELEPQSNEE